MNKFSLVFVFALCQLRALAAVSASGLEVNSLTNLVVPGYVNHGVSSFYSSSFLGTNNNATFDPTSGSAFIYKPVSTNSVSLSGAPLSTNQAVYTITITVTNASYTTIWDSFTTNMSLNGTPGATISTNQAGVNIYTILWQEGEYSIFQSTAPINGNLLVNIPFFSGFAASDESTAITTTTNAVRFQLPFAVNLMSVYASLSVAQTSGSIFTIDVKENGTSIFSTLPTIDNGDFDTSNPVTPAVISDSSIAAFTPVVVSVTQVGDGTAKGLKVWFIGSR